VSALCNASAYPFCTPLLFAVTMRINPTLRPSVSTLFNAKVRFAAALRIGSVLSLRTSLLLSAEQSHSTAVQRPSAQRRFLSFSLRDSTTL
jgi:hypothetical protein